MKTFLCLTLLAVLHQGYGYEDKTIVQYLTENNFTVLASLIKQANLTSLSSPGQTTLFAPTDTAFRKLNPNTLQAINDNPVDLLRVLKFHMVPGFVITPMATPAGDPHLTLEGQNVTLLRTISGEILINGVARVINADLVLNNGVVQAIDHVLIPSTFASETIAQKLLRDDTRFKNIFLGMLLADQIKILESGDFTVFAPVDHAFNVYADNLLSLDSPNALRIYQDVFRYHIVPNTYLKSQLVTGQLYTLSDVKPINVTVTRAGVLVNHAIVLEANIGASNGVIHVIDRILIPPGLSYNSTSSP